MISKIVLVLEQRVDKNKVQELLSEDARLGFSRFCWSNVCPSSPSLAAASASACERECVIMFSEIRPLCTSAMHFIEVSPQLHRRLRACCAPAETASEAPHPGLFSGFDDIKNGQDTRIQAVLVISRKRELKSLIKVLNTTNFVVFKNGLVFHKLYFYAFKARFEAFDFDR